MRKTFRSLLCIAILLTSHYAFPAAGDSPCTAVQFESCTSIGYLTYTLSSTGNWTTAGNGVSDPSGTCLNTGSKDVNHWFYYTATADDQSIAFNFAKPGGGGSIAECAAQVYSAASCSSAFTLVACENNSGDDHVNTSAITVTAGTIYYVRLFEANGNGSGNSFQASISITKNTTTGKSACDARSISSLPFSYSSNTLCNGNTIAANCASKTAGVSGSGEDYWFRYTSAGNEYITINLTGLNPAITQGMVIASPVANCTDAKACYSSSTANGTFPGGITGVSNTASALCRTIYLSSAGDYYFIIDASLSRGGPFTLSVAQYDPTGTTDACGWAQGITPAAASYTIDNCTSTTDHTPAEPNEPISALSGASGCGFTAENSKWLTFVADSPAPSEIEVSVSSISCSDPDYGNSAGLQMGIFTGACGDSWTKVGSCISSTSSGFSQIITSPPAGQQYYVVVDGIGGSICSFGISATNVVSLPITIVSFTARFSGKAVDLEWVSATENGNDYYTIERSLDGVTFEPVMQVDAAGTSSQESHYAVVDPDVTKGIIYYRLQQTDNDGKSTYLGIATAEVDLPSGADIKIMPNPGRIAQVVLPGEEGEFYLEVTDMKGKQVRLETVHMTKGTAVTLDLDGYEAGIYSVCLYGTGKVWRSRFLKID